MTSFMELTRNFHVVQMAMDPTLYWYVCYADGGEALLE